MSGSFGELGSLLKQAQKMQRDLDKVREELRGMTVEGLAQGVTVQVAGDRQVVKVELSQELVASGEKSVIEERLLLALRDGVAKASKLAEEKMGKVTGGMNLPGLF